MSKTFIIDCHICRAKVAAIQEGSADRHYADDDDNPHGRRVLLGRCPVCSQILVGEALQLHFENYDSDTDQWSDVVRVYPFPPKAFSSYRIPKVLRDSLLEVEKVMQAGAHTAACVMLGRSLEALCRDNLKSKDIPPDGSKPVRFMLGAGLQRLKELKIIDDRLFEWGGDLQAFRNLAAHPDDDATNIIREDVEDLQAFVYAITEYVYDLTDRYEEFKERQEERKRPRKSVAEMFASVKFPTS